LEAVVSRLKRPIIQEYIEGREFTIDLVADGKGNVLAVVPRERLEVKAGIVSKGRTVRDEKLSNCARRIAEALGIVGPCNIQCRLRDNVPTFFDINPRFSAGLPLTTAAGVNAPLILLQLALGLPTKKTYEFRPGIYMARYWEEVYYDEAGEALDAR
jgi:carbamoyl-phosphate synthase large subunit